ncbi:inner membrane magnesium transporter MRS2 [Gaeumannomyces tritici R3-111a-1]|uniref:Magnesium transporter n=1 Tax=Gaeumannomyces tritici (strain R3-111a-1) TaxID=644352 RepID=J3PDP2_GAET3|nr:inner membrane magnesium transporter MRS2 [Gaeumannomyces tritici R3-111a-1]EJT70592.1 inner membrane magnesium transporter MRS2 [Gaeumannomyces tritici R3-111a-1]
MPPPAPSLPVPSPRLLRFLRLQTDGLASSLGAAASRHVAAAVSSPCRTPRASVASRHQQCLVHGRISYLGGRPLPSTARAFSASATPRNSRKTAPAAPPKKPEASLQASLFSVDSILPRALRRRRSSLGERDAGQNMGNGGASSSPSPLSAPMDHQQPRREASKMTWQQRLWGARKPLRRSDDMCGDDGGSDSNFTFGSRRTQLMRAPMDPRLRCTEVDENGEVILVDGEYKKSELIAKYGLLPRDLRKIDSSNLPHILVRPSAILLNLLHLRVLIKSDRVLLFDVFGSKTSYNQSAFMYDLQGRLRQKQQGPNSVGGLPYEFRALEAVLISATTALEADLYTVREPVVRVLRELEDDINRDRLRILLVLSKKVSTFDQKAKLVRDAIDELLEADDDLAAMYLTEKRHDLYRGEDDHTEVEMLLESYHKICDEVVQEAGSLVSSIRNTEEIIRAILDANRNSLMLLDLKFSIGTLGLAMGTFLAGLYGMNLENFIEETNWGFAGVTSFSVVFSLLVCWYGLVKLRKVQRVKMHGSEARAHLDSAWFREDYHAGTNHYGPPSSGSCSPASSGGSAEDRFRAGLRRAEMMKNNTPNIPKTKKRQ